jgi:hypothetical protein
MTGISVSVLIPDVVWSVSARPTWSSDAPAAAIRPDGKDRSEHLRPDTRFRLLLYLRAHDTR